MLNMQLGTVPLVGLPTNWPTPRPAVLTLEQLASFQSRGQGTQFAQVTLPPPGSTLLDGVYTPEGSFVLRLILEIDGTRVAVVVGPVSDGDSLFVLGGLITSTSSPYQPHHMYSGNVMHRLGPNQQKNCEVRCDHGQLIADECCVRCTKNDVTLKFCC